jgi:hypothetical protein
MGSGSSLNVGAMSRVYLNDGHLLGYNLAGGSIVAECVKGLQQLQ